MRTARMRLESMGTTVRATTREASREKVTVKARSRNSSRASPRMNSTRGRNTATVVRVEAMTALPISSVPCRAASLGFTPLSR